MNFACCTVFKIYLTHRAKEIFGIFCQYRHTNTRKFGNIEIHMPYCQSCLLLKNIWWAKISIFSFNTHREKPEKFDGELPCSILSLKAQMKIIGEEISIKLCQNVNAYHYNNSWFNSPWLILYFDQIVAAVHLRVMWEDNPTLYYAPLFHMTKLSNNLQI